MAPGFLCFVLFASGLRLCIFAHLSTPFQVLYLSPSAYLNSHDHKCNDFPWHQSSLTTVDFIFLFRFGGLIIGPCQVLQRSPLVVTIHSKQVSAHNPCVMISAIDGNPRKKKIGASPMPGPAQSAPRPMIILARNNIDSPTPPHLARSIHSPHASQIQRLISLCTATLARAYKGLCRCQKQPPAPVASGLLQNISKQRARPLAFDFVVFSLPKVLSAPSIERSFISSAHFKNFLCDLRPRVGPHIMVSSFLRAQDKGLWERELPEKCRFERKSGAPVPDRSQGRAQGPSLVGFRPGSG